MQQYKKVIFTFDVPFKTVSVDSANDLQRFFEQLYTTEFNKFDLNKLLSDYSNLTESKKIDFNKNGILSIVETTDTYKINVSFKRVFSEEFSMGDTDTKLNVAKILSDSFLTSDHIKVITNFIRLFSDSLLVTDVFDKIFTKVPLDQINLSDVLRKNINSILTPENIVMVDTLSISTQDYEECQVTLSEYFNTLWSKIVQESLTFIDTITFSSNKNLIDLLGFIEQRLYNISKILSESIAATDAGTVLINTYIDPIYFSENYIGSAQTF